VDDETGGEFLHVVVTSLPGRCLLESDIPSFVRDLRRALLEYQLGIESIYLNDGSLQVGSRDLQTFIEHFNVERASGRHMRRPSDG